VARLGRFQRRFGVFDRASRFESVLPSGWNL